MCHSFIFFYILLFESLVYSTVNEEQRIKFFKFNEENKKVKLDLGDERVYGFAVDDPYFVVLFDTRLVLYSQYNADTLHAVHKIEFHSKIDDLQLLKFTKDGKFILFCDSQMCRICSVRSSTSCIKYPFDRDGNMLAAKELRMSFLLVSDKFLIIRYLNIMNESVMLKYNYRSQNVRKILPTQKLIESKERNAIQDVILAFTRNNYIFFIGNMQPIFNPSKIESDFTEFHTKITRICLNDTTEQFNSMMTMAIACKDITRNNQVRIAAAHYNEEIDEIIILMEDSINEHRKLAICRFEMQMLDKAFEQLWDDCQKKIPSEENPDCSMHNSAWLSRSSCSVRSLRKDNVWENNCFKYTRDSVNTIKNCDVTEKNNYGFVLIEQNLPLFGKTILRLPDLLHNITNIRPSKNGETFYLMNSENTFFRLLKATKSHPMVIWSKTFAQQSKNYFSLNSNANTIYYISEKGNKIMSLNLTCSMLYESCEQIEEVSWSDPLQCRWCLRSDGSGLAISKDEYSKCTGYVLDSFCPAIIEKVFIPSSQPSKTIFEIEGKNFDRLLQVHIDACNAECSITQFGTDKIVCYSSQPFDPHDKCRVKLGGQLGIYGSYNTSYTLHSMPKYGYSTTKRMSKSTKVVISIVVVIILISVIAFLIFMLRRYQMNGLINAKYVGGSNCGVAFTYVENNTYAGYYSGLHPTCSLYEKLYSEIDEKLKIPIRNLIIDEKIGKGHYGIVYKGMYIDKSGASRVVACKTISQNDRFVTSVREFLCEGLTMANFDHPNVMALIGISLNEKQCPVIVTDYLENGDLHRYIIDVRNRLTLGILLNFAIQIANGMEYLHSKRFIHRDLAARNCMLGSSLEVRISDFGLSRNVSINSGIYESTDKSREIPVKWMPIESLEENQYSFKADVWAYGIVLWELATRGMMPYEHWDSLQILMELKKGYRLPKPKGCPDILYNNVMKLCWLEIPERRPSFSELLDMVNDVLRQLRDGKPGNTLLDDHYERVSPRSELNTPVQSIDVSIA